VTQILQGERYRSAVLAIPRFGVQVRAVSLERRVYFPVRAVCMVLGISHQPQKARLKADSRFADALRGLPVSTSGGYQDTLCIRKDMVAAWLGLIDPSHCKLAKTRERLQEFQAELFAAADRFLFGDAGAPGTSAIDAAPGSSTVHSVVSGVLHVGYCPGCGMALCLTLDGGVAHLTPEPDSK
jgi:hypothetical protein